MAEKDFSETCKLCLRLSIDIACADKFVEPHGQNPCHLSFSSVGRNPKQRPTAESRGLRRRVSLKDILPDGFCLLAFLSVYPYMLTLINGGWFNWVHYNESVIVNCPHPKGIAMYVKQPLPSSGGCIDIEILKRGEFCYNKYFPGRSFKFFLDKNNNAWLNLIYNAIPLALNKISGKLTPEEFHLNINNYKLACKIQ